MQSLDFELPLLNGLLRCFHEVVLFRRCDILRVQSTSSVSSREEWDTFFRERTGRAQKFWISSPIRKYLTHTPTIPHHPSTPKKRRRESTYPLPHPKKSITPLTHIPFMFPQKVSKFSLHCIQKLFVFVVVFDRYVNDELDQKVQEYHH